MISELKFVIESLGEWEAGISPYFNIVTVKFEYEEFEENLDDFIPEMKGLLGEHFDGEVTDFEQYEKERKAEQEYMDKLEREEMEMRKQDTK